MTDDLTTALRTALLELEQDVPPRPGLEERLIAATAENGDEGLTGDDALAVEAAVRALGVDPSRRRQRMRLALAVACTVLLVAALGGVLRVIGGGSDRSDGPAAPRPTGSLSELLGTTWIGSGQELRFTATTVTNGGDCGDMVQAVHISGYRLEFGRTLSVTSSTCTLHTPETSSENLKQIEAQELKASAVLRSTVTWSIEDGTLTLTAPNGVSITLTRESPPTTDRPLVGTTWTPDPAFGGIRGVTFTPTSTVVNGACSGYSLALVVSGSRMTFGGLVGPGRICSPAANLTGPNSEQDFEDRLDIVTHHPVTWTIHGNRLTLTSSSGATVSFVAK